ncbi:MAG TPA: SEC-C metal-binding domain-containing protein, partial [Bryobacteraceae bacterium]|nr:SEC-C metal-binding domain-containing protein [Bryobacteraceae bacterium]
NRQNAERSPGPVTAAGKARVSQNATKLGLFSVANFVRAEEQNIFHEFETGYLAELSPGTPLEQTLSREIVQAAWRLRRCAGLETAPPENMTDEDLDRLQASIDRARAAAQRTFHRSLKELRRLQSEHLVPAALMIQQAMATDALLMKDLEDRQRQFAAESAAQSAQAVRGPLCAIQETNSAKQTQSEPEKTVLIPRGAPCPCKSGEKYKRCCGKNAPPVLSAKAA